MIRHAANTFSPPQIRLLDKIQAITQSLYLTVFEDLRLVILFPNWGSLAL